MKTISGSDIKLEAHEAADKQLSDADVRAFSDGMRREINGALEAWHNQLAKTAWGDASFPTEVRARYVPTIRERIRWRWRAMRQGIARVALWVLRVDARELCDCEY